MVRHRRPFPTRAPGQADRPPSPRRRDGRRRADAAALALALPVILLGPDVAVISFTDVLATVQSQPPLTIADLVFDETPFLIFALAGVGLFIRRELPDTVARLGLVVPQWWQMVVALAAAGAFFVFVQQ